MYEQRRGERGGQLGELAALMCLQTGQGNTSQAGAEGGKGGLHLKGTSDESGSLQVGLSGVPEDDGMR